MNNTEAPASGLKDLIEEQRLKLNLTKSALYAKTAIPRSSFDRKLANPELFTIQDLAKLSEVLEVELVQIKAA